MKALFSWCRFDKAGSVITIMADYIYSPDYLAVKLFSIMYYGNLYRYKPDKFAKKSEKLN